MSDVNKLPALFYKTQQDPSGTNVLRLDMCRSTISLSKITHQMWPDHPFSQRNKITKRAVGLKVSGEGKGGLNKIEKGGGRRGGRQYRGSS